MKFKAGNIVTLKIGGPDMVMEIAAEDGGIVCIWFDGRRLKREIFRPETLRKVSKAKPPETPDVTLSFLDGEGNEVSRMKLVDPKQIERS